MTIKATSTLILSWLGGFVIALNPLYVSATEYDSTNTPPEEELRAIGKGLDKLSKYAEEWGTIHFSAPMLVQPSTNFNFNLQRGTSNYFSEAKSEIQAQAAVFNQAVQSLSIALQLQNMPGITNSAGATNTSTPPAATNALGVINGSQFAAAFDLLKGFNGSNPTLGNKEALSIAAANQTTEAIFRLMGDPEKAAQYAGKKVVFGTVMVSVNPGYRTRADYVADLGVQINFEYVEARHEVARRWLLSTNLSDELRANILASYKWLSDDDLVEQIKWTGRDGVFKDLKQTITNLAKIKLQLSATNALLNSSKEKILAAPTELELRKSQAKAAHKLLDAAIRKRVAATAGNNIQERSKAEEAVAEAQDKADASDEQVSLAQNEVGKGNTEVEEIAKRVDELSKQRDSLYNSYQLVLCKLNSIYVKDSEVVDLTEITNIAPTAPLAMAVSPLEDLDVIDEGNSQRKQTAFALSLAGLLQKAGMQAQASAFEQYANRIESDSRTRTALPAVTSYADGGQFGWQIGPRFRALKDTGATKSGAPPANVLDRQTFPAMIIIGFNAQALSPRLAISNKTVSVLEPKLNFVTVPRWLRIADGRWTRWWQPRYRDSELLRSAFSVVGIRNHISRLGANSVSGGDFSKTATLSRNRLEALNFDVFGGHVGQVFDVQQVVPLPDAPALPVPAISAVFPNGIQLAANEQGNLGQTNLTFVLVGSNLKGVESVTNVTGGMRDIVLSKPNNNNFLSFTGTIITNEPIIFQVSAKLTNSDGTIFATNVMATSVVNVAFHPDAGAPQAIVKTVQTVSNGTNAMTEFTVKVAPHYDAKALESALSIMINEINKAKPQNNGNVSVQVQADQKK